VIQRPHLWLCLRLRLRPWLLITMVLIQKQDPVDTPQGPPQSVPCLNYDFTIAIRPSLATCISVVVAAGGSSRRSHSHMRCEPLVLAVVQLPDPLEPAFGHSLGPPFLLKLLQQTISADLEWPHPQQQ
jgi:hypothetical protein